MQLRKALPVFLLIAVMILAACSQAAPAQDAMMEAKPTEVMVEKPKEAMATAEVMAEKPKEAMATAEVMMEKPKEAMATAEVMKEKAEEAMMAPSWFSAPLTDVATNQSFTINDLKGKVVLVENMAQWCPNCLKQQKQVAELHNLLGERDDFVSLALDIDPNEDANSLKAYIDENGFTWKYAVTPAKISREIGQLYGNQFLSPSATPMLIIDRQGKVHPLPFGVKSAADLQAALQPFLDQEK
jgi:thiol-disulfide isomerase/thioredoxin